MSFILHIETATAICSVALSKDNKLIAWRETNEPYAHSSVVTQFVDDVIKEAGINITDLKAVAVSKGPGSYTGLRIGVSTAKGFCYSLDIPLISIDTLQAMAYGVALNNKDENILFCPMIDARRMEVYNAIYDTNNQIVKAVSADIIDENSYMDIVPEKTLLCFGDGADKCKDTIKRENIKFINAFPSAKNMIELAYQKFITNTFEDIAYFEPFYLKDFVAGKPSVKGLK